MVRMAKVSSQCVMQAWKIRCSQVQRSVQSWVLPSGVLAKAPEGRQPLRPGFIKRPYVLDMLYDGHRLLFIEG